MPSSRFPALVIAVAVIVGACAPSATESPVSTGPASTRPAATATAGGPVRLVVDTDVAADDVTALASLVRDPSVELLAVTVVGTGEAHCPGGMFVVRSVLTMLDAAPIPVACGRETPLGDAEAFPDTWRAGADSGNGLRLAQPAFLPDDRPAEQVLVDLAAAEAAAGRKLTILTLGTWTNLAGAAALDPAFAGRVRVVAMLGAIGVAGNAAPNGEPNPTAEWNAHADPSAVRAVLEAGFDVTLVPLDATNDVPLRPALYDELGTDHAAGPADLVYELWSINSFMTAGGFYLWDPLASAVVRDPSIVTTRSATLRAVEGAGSDGGRLVEDPAGAPVTVAIAADDARFEALLLAALRRGPAREGTFNPVATLEITAGSGTCEVTTTGPIPKGLVQVRLTATDAGPGEVIIFATAGVPWSALEAYVAHPDPDRPPAVETLGGPQYQAAGTTSSFVTVGSGPLGIACVTGDFASPTVLLRGPFEVAG